MTIPPANDDQEQTTLLAGKCMTLRERLQWLEEMHDLVLRWSRKRVMTYPDGTTLGPDSKWPERPGDGPGGPTV